MTRNLDGTNRVYNEPYSGVLPQAAIQLILDRLVKSYHPDHDFCRMLKDEYGITLEDLELAAVWHAARAL